MAKATRSFRIGKVQAYLRGSVWYLCYHDNGQRRRPRVGSDREVARQMASQINGQLAVGAPAALSFEPIAIPALRDNWLQHHELVLRSSVQTIDRYRRATDHLLRFLTKRPVRHASQFQAGHAEEFVRYLRTIHVSPNGHKNTAKRPLLDKGLRFILECPTLSPAEKYLRQRNSKLQDFLHGAHFGQRKRAAFGFEMRDHIFDYLAQINVDFLRIIPVNPRDKVGTLADVDPVFFAPFDPFVIVVALSHSWTSSIARWTCFSWYGLASSASSPLNVTAPRYRGCTSFQCEPLPPRIW